MKVDVQPGTYVVAVSGGVDSMVLLDVLRQQPGLKLVVAHFDHGIRQDSQYDRELVQQFATQHNLPFVYHEGKLGIGASEDIARKARYEFLHKVREASGARAVITAHHHDDAVETAVMNLLRGTNRKGLTSLRSRTGLVRPLLHVSKKDLRDYAHDQGLVWREDSTNTDTRFMRNYIRHKVLPKLPPEDQQKLKEIISRMHQINAELDEQLSHFLHIQPGVDQLDRKLFIRLPHAVAREVLAAWLRKHGLAEFDEKTLERVVVAAKTFKVGGIVDIAKGYKLRVTRDRLALECPDR